MGNDKKSAVKPVIKTADTSHFDDDLAKADALESQLNALAEKSEDSLKPKNIEKKDKESKWDSLDETENAAAIAPPPEDDTWF